LFKNRELIGGKYDSLALPSTILMKIRSEFCLQTQLNGSSSFVKLLYIHQTLTRFRKQVEFSPLVGGEILVPFLVWHLSPHKKSFILIGLCDLQFRRELGTSKRSGS